MFFLKERKGESKIAGSIILIFNGGIGAFYGRGDVDALARHGSGEVRELPSVKLWPFTAPIM